MNTNRQGEIHQVLRKGAVTIGCYCPGCFMEDCYLI